MNILESLPVRPESITQYRNQLHRTDGDIDLVLWVRNLFAKLGYEEQLVECFDSHSDIQKAKDKGPDLQRFYLNQYWSMQLLHCQNETGQSTLDQRAFLTSHGSVAEWMVFFENSVFPAIIHHQLPVKIA